MEFAIQLVGKNGFALITAGKALQQSLEDIGFHTYAFRVCSDDCFFFNLKFSNLAIDSQFHKFDVIVNIDDSNLSWGTDALKENGIFITSSSRPYLRKSDRQILDKKAFSYLYIPSDIVHELNLSEDALSKNNILMMGFLWKVLGIQKVKALEHNLASILVNHDSKYVAQNILHKGFTADYQEWRSLGLDFAEGSEVISLSVNLANILSLQESLRDTMYVCNNHDGTIISSQELIIDAINACKFTKVFNSEEGYHSLGVVTSDIDIFQSCVNSYSQGQRSVSISNSKDFDNNISKYLLALRDKSFPMVNIFSNVEDVDIGKFLALGIYWENNLAITFVPSNIHDFKSNLREAIYMAEKCNAPVNILLSPIFENSFLSYPGLKKNVIVGNDFGVDLEQESVLNLHSTGIASNNSAQNKLHSNTANSFEIAEYKQSNTNKLSQKEISNIIPQPKIYSNADDIKSFILQKTIGVIVYGTNILPISRLLPEFAKQRIQVEVLHYEYMYPIDTATVTEFFKKNNTTLIIENNSTGLFAKAIRAETSLECSHKLLKTSNGNISIDDIKIFIERI